LKTFGYTIHSAENGNQALEILEKQKLVPDLVVTDVIMPGMGGQELSEILVKKIPELKIIFTSGYTGNQILNDGFLSEDINFLQKPYSLADLSAKVRRVLDGIED